MRKLVALLTFCLLPVLVEAQDAQAGNKSEPKVASVKKISAVEAKDHINETLIVTGKVAQVTILEKLTYLNLDQKYPETPLSGVIFGRVTNRFGDLSKLEGQQVEIKGKIEAYREKPQIVLKSTNQLKVLEMRLEKPEKE